MSPEIVRMWPCRNLLEVVEAIMDANRFVTDARGLRAAMADVPVTPMVLSLLRQDIAPRPEADNRPAFGLTVTLKGV